MIYQRWALRAMIPVFIGASLFFALFIELLDLFNDLPRYLQMKQDFLAVLSIQLLYLPKCLSFGFPIAMVFAVSLTLGNFYANNELIAVFSSGVSLFRFGAPLLLFAVAVSIGSFFFNEYVVIDALKMKTELKNKALGLTDQDSNPNVVLFDKGTSVVYRAQVYNDGDQSLSNVMVVIRDELGRVSRIITAPSARWSEEKQLWLFNNASSYRFELPEALTEAEVSAIAPEYTKQDEEQLAEAEFNLAPRAFRRVTQNIDEMKVGPAANWVDTLKSSGLPYRSAETKLHERFSFACTPLIVAFVASAIGSRFKKNILLLSLLVSLMLSVIYYVLQMISGLLSSLQAIPSVMGAWFGVIIYLAVGVILLRRARS